MSRSNQAIVAIPDGLTHERRAKMKCISFLAAALCCGNANAYQIIIGNVAMLQPTYLPAVVTFQMTTGSSVCPAGAWLQWTNPDQSNNKAVYAKCFGAGFDLSVI